MSFVPLCEKKHGGFMWSSNDANKTKKKHSRTFVSFDDNMKRDIPCTFASPREKTDVILCALRAFV